MHVFKLTTHSDSKRKLICGRRKTRKRPANTRGGAYPGCSLSWSDRGSCCQGPTTSMPFITPPTNPPPPPVQAVGDLQGSEVKGREERRAFLLSFSQERKGKCLCECVGVCTVRGHLCMCVFVCVY